MALTAELRKVKGRWWVSCVNKTRNGYAQWGEGPYRWKMMALLKIWVMIRIYG